MKRPPIESRSVLLSTGAACTAVSLYQLIALELAHFYAMFSLGATLILSGLYAFLSHRRVFHGWGIRKIVLFFLLLLSASVVIDRIGMHVGYWEYPHYDADDTVRKYLFEWVVALFYHLVAFVIGIELFERSGANRRTAQVLSLLVVVTAVGFVTESLNLRVYSWRVKRMPLSNAQIGEYYLVFQTVGYWLMALIPYGLMRLTELVGRSVVSRRNE